ncbi:Site-specific recombinase XerC [Klenkia marina]|uniref:Site-specific recombinase XerC n=1 Tax=Klenkia marina TaxID=1960309 RepID=A0A1G4Y669_9ACTN|nr:site-specific integrase [Klenkia marina]SCX48915.1 Site-specific recombinase XerC [Klenkia marina]
MTSKAPTETRRRQGSGSVTELPSGSVRLRYRVDGKTVTMTFPREGAGTDAQRTARARKTAEAHMRRAQVAIEDSNHPTPGAGLTRFVDYADAWLAARKVQGRPLAPTTRDLYRGQLDRWILPTFGRVELGKITPARVRAWHGMLTDLVTGAGPTGAPKCYKLLKSILTTAVEDGEIRANPCTIKGAGSEPVNPRPDVELEHVQAIADAIAERWRAMVLVAGFCGLRFGELAALRRRDVDLMRGVIHVRRTAGKVKGQGRVIRETTKNGTHRVVAVPSHIADDLAHHLATYAASDPEGLMFVGPRGGPLRSNNFTAADGPWRAALVTAGLGDTGLHGHDFRHHAATTMAVVGGSVADIKRLLGHRSDAMAIRYTQSSPARQAELAELVSERARLAPVQQLRPSKIIAS